MSILNNVDNQINQLYVQFNPILSDYKIIKNISPSVHNGSINPEFSKIYSRFFTNLQFLLSNLAAKSTNDHERKQFLENYNDLMFEFVSIIGEILNSIPQHEKEAKTILFSYSSLIINLAERSPIKYHHLRNMFNKLIGNLINLLLIVQDTLCNSFINQCVHDNNLLYELYRALGSLVYENGPLLSDQNITSIFSSVTNLELQIEDNICSLQEKKLKIKSQEQIDILYKLKLISTQLIFNMTMARINKDQDTDQIEKEFIQDEHKIKCAEFLVKVLRFNNSIKLKIPINEKSNNQDELKSEKSLFGSEEFMINVTKTMIKALHGLENLFLGIDNSSNWIQIKKEKFQLGDILAVVKDLCLFGLITSNSSGALVKENKLEPSNVDVLIQEENKTQPEENDQDLNNYLDGENKESSEKKNRKLNYNKAIKPGKRENEKGKNSKFVRNNSNKKNQTQPAQSSQYTNKYSDNDSALQYIKEAQVPLFNYKNVVSSLGNDSDTSDSSFAGSNFNIEKSKAKVRVAAFGALLTIFQKLDRRTIVSYWKSFLESNNTRLFYSVKNDPSPKVRLLAATALALYLEYVRSFFSIAAADDLSSSLSFQSNQSHQSFLPISYTISTIIRQLYNDIFICLNREPFQLNQINLLKCLQQLIKATPYQKLKPGLLYKLILSLNILLEQKNSILNQSLQNKEKTNVLHEILNCLNTILVTYYHMAEVHMALVSPLKNMNTFMSQGSVRSSTCSSIMEEEDLSDKFEKFTNLKVPNINQTRVKYFYESNTASGQMTPNCKQMYDLNYQENSSNSKSWLVDFCIQNSLSTSSISVPCLDLLAIMAQHYFDLMKKEILFENLCQLILENLNCNFNSECQNSNQLILRTIKFTEEFCRCLATHELRQMNSIDLNDCCKLWSNLLNSKLLSEYLIDEQRYLISSSACDCLASIGAPIFELLPYQKRIFCLTNLLHLTKSQSNLIRAASVRALGVYVTFASLKEDQNFLTDLSLCLLNLIKNDSNNLVRQKTAWSMSNLSEVLIENIERVGNVFIEEFNLNLWYQLLDSATIACQRESEKLKSYLVRALGNLINYASSTDIELLGTQLDLEKVGKSIGKAIETLCQCKNVKMLKVKWNLSHAIGVAMKKFNNWTLSHKNPHWLQLFYGTLLELFVNSNNFKVRINACIALMSINTGDVNIIRSNANESIYLKIWYGLIEGFSKLKNENMDATNEIQHKNTLTHQLCKLFTFLCKYLRIEDLEKLMTNSLNQLKLNSNPKQTSKQENINLTLSELRNYIVDYIKTIYDQIESHKIEVQLYNEALTNLNFLNLNKNSSFDEDCVNLLNGILLKPKEEKSYDDSESSETETIYSSYDNKEKNTEYRKKFPFKSVYD